MLKTTSKIFNILTLVSSLAILATLSYEIIYLGKLTFSALFIKLQLIICLIFIIDFSLRMSLSQNKSHFLLYNFPLLLVSVPVLNILMWLKFDISSHEYVIYRLIPIIRGIYGLILVARWLSRSGIVSLIVSYTTTVFVFTYSASLLFFSLERQINPSLENFGDALWWSWMNLTTVGANIFAQTTIGKVLTVMLSSLGMMMFPIFTAFIISEFEGKTKRR